MLTANYLMNVAEPLVDLWSQVECDIIQDIARRIVKTGNMTETAEWQIRKAREMGILQEDISQSLARATKLTKKTTRQMVLDACKTALAFDDAMYIKKGYVPLPLAQSLALQEVIEAGIRKTEGLMRNFTRTTANTATRAFENALDRAYLQTVTGAFSYEESLRRCIRDLAEQGIEKIAYPSGHVSRMDAASRRALLTGLNQTTAELQLARMEEVGAELIEVTSHAGARPSHAEWQGQVYCRKGRTKEYENFEDATGYGTGDGLCGWNCYHSFFPYFEGLSKQAFDRDPARLLGKTNDQMYEESQKQRAYERKIRDSRRECAALSSAKDAATDPETKAALEDQFQKAAVKLKGQEGKLQQFCDQTGRTNLTERLYVPSYNRSVSGKTTWAARKAAPTAKASVASAAASSSPTTGFKKIKGAHTVEQDLAATNPNYLKGKAWQINCQRCCPTYEMRRRGYDVIAKPFGTDKDPVYTDWQNIFAGADWKSAAANRTPKSKENVENLLKQWGDGARAEVYVAWKSGSAHVFMAENHAGTVSFIDPQCAIMDASSYFALTKPSRTLVCRLDQLTPTNLIKECCQ